MATRKGATETKTRKPSRFKAQLVQSRPARGTRPVYVHGQVVYVPREKGTPE